MRRPRPHRLQEQPRAGVTLIELLLALSIAVLFVALLYSIYHAVARTAESQRDRQRSADPVTTAHAWMKSDLEGTLLDAENAACAFVVQPDEAAPLEKAVRLDLCTARPSRNESDLQWAETWRVSYRVVASGSGRPPALLREARPLTGPESVQPPSTNVLLANVSSFEVEVYDGAAWRPQWLPAATPKDARPHAARIQVHDEGGQSALRAEFFIPAGNVLNEEQQDEE